MSARRRASAPPRPWWRRAWVVQVGLIALLAAASFVLWTDLEVRTRMEGRLWRLPARVYARPLELYAGAAVGLEAVRAELARLGYRQVRRLSGPGQYALGDSGLLLHSRGFLFDDGAEPARVAQVRFEGERVAGVREARGGTLEVMRLEPVELGRINPGDTEDRVLVSLAEVPPVVLEAVLTIEDRHFFSHPGLDLRGILRAAWRNLRAGAIQEGGSTITQQLVKNLFVGSERSLARKLHEALIALVVEFRYDKEQILEAYLNEIYLGQQGSRAIHGVGRAAGFYFGRPVSELTLPEAALIAGLARGASMYDPRRFPDRALARRNLVLEGMLERELIDQPTARAAQSAPLGLVARGTASQRHPAYFDLVRRQLAADYRAEDLEGQGLQIHTTLDPALQEAVEAAVLEGLEALGSTGGGGEQLQAAVVVCAPDTGEVLAVVGDRDPRFVGFNRATEARRPIGSLAKPFVYLTALATTRYSVASRVDDAPVDLRDASGRRWQPRNYDGRVHGRVGFDEALARSYNLAAVRLGLELGVPAVQRSLRAAGVEGDIPPYPSLMLGSVSLTPLELAQAYGAIANGGAVFPPRTIRAVLTREGRALRRYGLEVRQSLDPRAAFLTTWLMTGVVESGTARALASRLPAHLPLAGKTGTTDDLRDSWYAGYGQDYLAVVWIGRDDNASTGLSGASGALKVWSALAARVPPRALLLQPPAGVEWVWVSADGRARSAQECPGARRLPFVKGTAPAGAPTCGGPAPASPSPGAPVRAAAPSTAPAKPPAATPPPAPAPRVKPAPLPGFRIGPSAQ